MNFLLTYFAGGVAALSPCVLPMLPVVAGSSLNSRKSGPLYLALGAILSFALIGILVAATGGVFGLELNLVRNVGSVVLILFGLLMIFPNWTGQRSFGFERLSNTTQKFIGKLDPNSRLSQFSIGSVTGIVWAPCAGPALGAAIGIASSGKDPLNAIPSMALFGVGIMTPFLFISYGLRNWFMKRRHMLISKSGYLKTFFGLVLIGFGTAVLTGYDKIIEAQMLNALPEEFGKFIFSF